MATTVADDPRSGHPLPGASRVFVLRDDSPSDALPLLHRCLPPTAPGLEDVQASAVVPCRAAVERWFGGLRRAEVVLLLVALVAIDRHSATLPRAASYDGPMVLRGMRRLTWFRLIRCLTVRAEEEYGRTRPGPRTAEQLRTRDQVEQEVAAAAVVRWRCALTSRAVRQMIVAISDEATKAGQIRDVGRLIAIYAARHQIDTSTAYKHWKVVRDLGLVRQTRHSAQGRHAQYQTAFPPAQAPTDLPKDWSLSGQVATWLEESEAVLDVFADVELVRYGSCRYSETSAPGRHSSDPGNTAQRNRCSLSAYYRQAWPLYARDYPPSPKPGHKRRPARSARPRSGGVGDTERVEAEAILARCRSEWARQREGAVLDAEACAELLGMVALVRRHVTASELVELLTERVASAKDLPGLLRWRLQRTLRFQRRCQALQVDEQGERWQAARAAEAARRAELDTEQAQAARAACRAALSAARAAKASSDPSEQSRARARAVRGHGPRPADASAAGHRVDQERTTTTTTMAAAAEVPVMSRADREALRWTTLNAQRAAYRPDRADTYMADVAELVEGTAALDLGADW